METFWNCWNNCRHPSCSRWWRHCCCRDWTVAILSSIRTSGREHPSSSSGAKRRGSPGLQHSTVGTRRGRAHFTGCGSLSASDFRCWDGLPFRQRPACFHLICVVSSRRPMLAGRLGLRLASHRVVVPRTDLLSASISGRRHRGLERSAVECHFCPEHNSISFSP